MKKLVMTFAVLALAAQMAVAAAPPQYFVDEAKLPFAELPGLPTQREWGVLGGAAYRTSTLNVSTSLGRSRMLSSPTRPTGGTSTRDTSARKTSAKTPLRCGTWTTEHKRK